MRVRFSIADDPNDSTPELGVDDFLARTFDHNALATLRNGTGINSTCFLSTPPVIGLSWVSTIDHSGHAGATLTTMLLYSKGATGPMLPGGELLIDLSSTKLLSSIETATGTSDTHAFLLPNDPAFIGLTFSAQAVILGGNYELCNAYDYVIGL